MRWFVSAVSQLLLVLSSLAMLPVAAADWMHSAPVPGHWKSAYQAESLRMAPGTASARRLALDEAPALEIAAVRDANSAPDAKRVQIGIGRDLAADPAAASAELRWEPIAGGMAAHWEVSSPEARALRVELVAARLPAGAEIRIAGAQGSGAVYGPFGAAEIPVGQGSWWSPVIEGDAALVEIFLPAGTLPAEMSVSLARLSHLFVSPTDGNVDLLAKNGASQSCEVDLVCRSASDAALAQVGKAVARMTFGDGVSAGTFFCTGTLVNSTAASPPPYFHSAAHCISTQASASTLATHWFYERASCGVGGTGPSYVQIPGGAALLYANETTDVLLLRLNANPPAGAIYAGWNAGALGTGTALTAVHHPAGDWKKVSLGSAGGFSAYGGGAGDTHIIALWNSTITGVTEGGSSGSAIFSAVGQPATDYQLRGGLHGGPSSCSATGVNLRDYYSRFDRAYPFLASFLNPGTSCTYTLSPASASVGAGASSGSFGVTTSSGCTWSASSNAAWLTTGSSGSGSGSVQYSVAANTGAARTGTITVGGQGFTVSQQAGSGGTSSNILVNGGFESGSASWTQQATSGQAIITSDAGRARTGSGVAWLGGYVSGTDTIYQDVAIPAGASPVTLQFWYRILTTETLGSAFDTFQVQVVNPSSGATLATVASYSNLNATSGWAQSPAISLSAYAGQTIRLRFTATNDFSNISSFFVDDITLTATTSSAGANYTALWWVPSEAGWGLNVNHQGSTIFATLYTYDSAGAPLWLVMSGGMLTSGTTYSGPLFRTTGPPFNAVPFTPIGPQNLTTVGTMTITFHGSNSATLSYTVNGVAVTKSIQQTVYGSRAANCVPTTASRASLTNYQDLWWNAAESGWGINVAHQDNTLFATLFNYDASGRGLWLVMSGGVRQTDGSYLGDLYQTSGPPFNAVPFTPIGVGNLTLVGTMRFRFTDGNTGTLTYSVNGITVTKAITRTVLSSPVPACS